MNIGSKAANFIRFFNQPTKQSTQQHINGSYIPKSNADTPSTTIDKRTTSTKPSMRTQFIKVDKMPGLDDFSGKSLDEIKALMRSPKAKPWAKAYVDALKDGKTLPMPGMKETSAKMRNVLQAFVGAYEILSEDRLAMECIKDALQKNAEHGYPNTASEEIALAFCVLRDFLMCKYVTPGDDQWPLDLNTTLFRKLDAQCYSSLWIVKDDWSYSNNNNKFINNRYSFLPEVFCNTEKANLKHVQSLCSVRILAMSDLSIEDFNRTFGLPVAYIGLLDKQSIAFHDTAYFLSLDFLIHDGFHAMNIHCEYNSHMETLHKLMTIYYNQWRPTMNQDVALIMDYLFFESIHESYIFGRNIHAESIINLIKRGFAISGHNEGSSSQLGKYLSKPLADSQKAVHTEEEQKIIQILESDTIKEPIKAYSIINEEMQRVSDNKLAFDFEAVESKLIAGKIINEIERAPTSPNMTKAVVGLTRSMCGFFLQNNSI